MSARRATSRDWTRKTHELRSFSTSAPCLTIHEKADEIVRMYDRTRPVCDGDTDVRVPTPNMATAKVRHEPKKSRRSPSQRWLTTCGDRSAA